MAAAWDRGVNFFDNAEVYAAGKSEEIMGDALAKLGWPRLKYVVSTKFFWGITDGPNEKTTLNRKYLLERDRRFVEAPEARLRRPRVLPPRRSRTRPIEETVWAMHDMIERGKALYWGTREWSARGDHGGVADRRAPSPAQARGRAARVQPLPPRRASRSSTRASTRTSASASRRGARSHRDCSRASTATACRPIAAARSRA